MAEQENYLERLADSEQDLDNAIKDGFFTRNRQGILWGTIGVLLGGGTGGTLWFLEKRKRQKTLEQIHMVLDAIVQTNAGSTAPAKLGKQHVAATEFLVRNNADLQRVINKYMVQGVLRGKEREQFERVIWNLTQLGAGTVVIEKVAKDNQ